MGLLNSVLIGLGEAGKASAPFIKNMQEEDIQKLRDERLSSLRKGELDYGIKANITAKRDEEAYQSGPIAQAQRDARAKGDAAGAFAAQEGLIVPKAEAAEKAFNAGAPLRAQQEAEALNTFRAKSAAELQAEVDKWSDPNYTKAMRSKRDATRDTSSDALHAVQLEAAKLALDEKKAEIKMPYADRQAAAGLREQLKSLSATVDKAMAEGTYDAKSESAQLLIKKQSGLNDQLTKLYAPFMGDVGKGALTKAPESKAATLDQVQSYAKKKGVSVDDATKALTAAGWTISGGQPAAKPDNQPSGIVGNAMGTTPSQSFNDVGYTTTQGTIDGAKRGDRKALAFLRQMLDEGGLTASERAQINALIK